MNKDWQDAYRFGMLRSDLNNKFFRAEGYLNKIRVIADFWRSQEIEIVEYAEKSRFKWLWSYPIDWSLIHTPIENDAWISIRRKGKIVLYPQYPVLNYQVDFGNPYLKIALELDGKEFHIDKLKDAQRDENLRKAGWTVFRVTGTEMWRTRFKDFSDFEGESWYENGQDEIENWILNTGDGVIEALRAVYFIRQQPLTDELDTFLRFCYRSLEKHCTTDSFDPFNHYETED